MAKNFLSNAERLELIEKYRADKLNEPPKNISDKTLIENFGTDEQKTRLQNPPAGETQEGAQNKAPEGQKNTEQGENLSGDQSAQNGDQNKSDEDALADLMGDAPAAPAVQPVRDRDHGGTGSR